jgi:hypothetical protein
MTSGYTHQKKRAEEHGTYMGGVAATRPGDADAAWVDRTTLAAAEQFLRDVPEADAVQIGVLRLDRRHTLARFPALTDYPPDQAVQEFFVQSAPELDCGFDSFDLYVCYPPAASAHPTALKLPTRAILLAIERVARRLVGKRARGGARVRLLRVTRNGRRFRAGASLFVRSGRVTTAAAA